MYARHIPGIWPARYFLASVRDFSPRSTLRVEKAKSRLEPCHLALVVDVVMVVVVVVVVGMGAVTVTVIVGCVCVCVTPKSFKSCSNCKVQQ